MEPFRRPQNALTYKKCENSRIRYAKKYGKGQISIFQNELCRAVAQYRRRYKHDVAQRGRETSCEGVNAIHQNAQLDIPVFCLSGS